MAMALIVARVEEPERWERHFRTHEPLFRSFGMGRTIFGIGKDNLVGLVTLIDDPDQLGRALGSPELVAAMTEEGMQRETMQLIILDRDLVQPAKTLEPAAA